MKTITTILAGLVLTLSSAVFAAEQHGTAALEHANMAVQQGKANDAKGLVKHASVALEHSLASAIVLKGVAKEHMEAGTKELEEAINHGNLGHADVATKHAEAAVNHITAGNK